MKNSPPKKSEMKSTDRRYGSVAEMLRGEHASQEVIDEVERMSEETRVTRLMAELRTRAGLTQQALAAQIGCSQSAISKLESGRDENLTLGEIRAYADALKERLGLVFGPPMNHVEAIKTHALAMRERMMDLASIAKADDQMEKEIQAFFGEAFFNILTILSTCQNALPNGPSVGFHVELMEDSQIKKTSRIDNASRELAQV